MRVGQPLLKQPFPFQDIITSRSRLLIGYVSLKDRYRSRRVRVHSSPPPMVLLAVGSKDNYGIPEHQWMTVTPLSFQPCRISK